MGWQDISGFARETKDRTPRTYELHAGLVRVVVTRIHGASGWFVRCDALRIAASPLITENSDVAKQLAVQLIRAELLRAARQLGETSRLGDTAEMQAVRT